MHTQRVGDRVSAEEKGRRPLLTWDVHPDTARRRPQCIWILSPTVLFGLHFIHEEGHHQETPAPDGRGEVHLRGLPKGILVWADSNKGKQKEGDGICVVTGVTTHRPLRTDTVLSSSCRTQVGHALTRSLGVECRIYRAVQLPVWHCGETH